jgi:hypothetical protein
VSGRGLGLDVAPRKTFSAVAVGRRGGCVMWRSALPWAARRSGGERGWWTRGDGGHAGRKNDVRLGRDALNSEHASAALGLFCSAPTTGPA